MFLTKLRPVQTWKCFGLLQIQKTSLYFQLNPQLFWKIDLKLCTYLTEEDAYLPSDRKNQGHFKLLRFVGLRLMLDGKLMLSIPSTVFLRKQVETLYKCYRHTVMYMCLFTKKKIFLTNLLLFGTKKYF